VFFFSALPTSSALSISLTTSLLILLNWNYIFYSLYYNSPSYQNYRKLSLLCKEYELQVQNIKPEIEKGKRDMEFNT